MTAAAIPVALAAAFCYAFAATLQHRAARRERPAPMLDPRLVLRLLRRPTWLGGAAADLGGAGLHAFALALGPLALVQPLLVCGLLLAVPLEAAMDHRQARRRDLAAVGLSGFGLAVLVVVLQPQPGPTGPTDTALLWVSIAVGLLTAALIGVALATTLARRATLLGIATGALYALAAALAKTCVTRLGDDPGGVLTDWPLYALIPVGIAAVTLNQNAFQAGTLAGPLTGITLTDPLVSIAIAVTAFGEQVGHGPARGVVAVLAAGVMAWGVWLVSEAWSQRPAH